MTMALEFVFSHMHSLLPAPPPRSPSDPRAVQSESSRAEDEGGATGDVWRWASVAVGGDAGGGLASSVAFHSTSLSQRLMGGVER